MSSSMQWAAEEEERREALAQKRRAEIVALAAAKDDDGVAVSAADDFLAGLIKARDERRAAVARAVPALARLVDVCRLRCGQSLKVRALLFSLWNGKATSLLELTTLDWTVRCDVVAVLAAFGDDAFFYSQISAAFEARGLFEWFTEEGDEP